MKAYQTLITYTLMAATLAGFAGCGKNTSKQATNEDKPTLERVVNTSSPIQNFEIPAVVYDKDSLFNLLSNTKGTELNRSREYANDPEKYLADEKKKFGTDYEDFVSDIVDNVFDIKYESAKPFIESAQNIAREINPDTDFMQDLVKIAYKRADNYVEGGYESLAEGHINFGKKVADEHGINSKDYAAPIVKSVFLKAAEYANSGYHSLAENSISFGKRVARAYEIETRYLVAPIIKNSFEKANQYAKGGYLLLAESNLDLGMKIAKEDGIDTKEFAVPVVQTAIEKAKSLISYPFLAQGNLDFGRKVAKANGLEDLVAQIDQLSMTMRR